MAAMERTDRWVAGTLALGVVLILLAILLVAFRTRVPVSHLYVNASGVQLLRSAHIPVHSAPDWPGAYRVNARATSPAFTATAKLFFAAGNSVDLPRSDVLLWVYRG